ncbi:MAG TPA: hypothetical protein VM619_14570 [Luteimonas sp.]|nr:hypothetical protein [Luteimonas sp.]
MLKLNDGDVSILVEPGLRVPLGKLVDGQILRIQQAEPNADPLLLRSSVNVSWEMSSDAYRRLRMFAFGYRRWLALRQQLKNERRRGWRHIR